MGENSRRETCLVIGGCSFIGQHLIAGLLADGFKVRLLDTRGTCKSEDVTVIRGDFCDVTELESALQDIDVVFHCVSLCSSDGNARMVDRVNIHATRVLVEACSSSNVSKLILVSSCSVISELGKHTRNGRECQPYARRPLDSSFRAKVSQEQLVLAANSPSLMTASVRVFAVFGPDDSTTSHDLFSINTSRYAVGSGRNISDFTYATHLGMLLGPVEISVTSRMWGMSSMV